MSGEVKPGCWIDDPVAEESFLLDCEYRSAAERLSSADDPRLNAIGDLAQECLEPGDPRLRLIAQRTIVATLVNIAPHEVSHG